MKKESEKERRKELEERNVLKASRICQALASRPGLDYLDFISATQVSLL